ncbi:PhzF family phenazine biosynthesis protein [Dethiothermospora halolimnae]|uniref:PhzF family phenazine biosynthesis protein n=1 Tax=Dethiothermospora halolimnae TaxID=3114390 RepID=UPI003CCC2215
MEIIMYQVDAFTDQLFGGNPAGVIADASKLDDNSMQGIAKEMNLSETAFVIPKDNNNFIVRFFTPKCEVDLCGHATIATFYTLAKKGYIKSIDNGIVTIHQETKVGKLPVDIYFKDNQVEKVLMYQGEPEVLGDVNKIDVLSNIFKLDSKDISLEGYSIKPQIVSTGLPDIIMPVRNKKLLNDMDINYNVLTKISEELKVGGVHAFTIDDGEIYCRNFAPALGINEESATGTANGALIYYLKKNNVLKGNEILSNQGQALGRPSKIYCEIHEKDDSYIVKVGGRAKIIIEGVINID